MWNGPRSEILLEEQEGKGKQRSRKKVNVRSSVLEAAFRAASATSASVLSLPLPPRHSLFISSYPTHLLGSG